MILSHIMLLSNRLRLTSFVPHDAREVYTAVTPSLTEFMTFDPLPSLEAFNKLWPAWIKKMESGSEASLVIRSAATDEFLGVAGLHEIGAPAPKVGIWIKEGAQGFGYGQEAVMAVARWAGQILRVRAILYPVVAQNFRSRRIAENMHGKVIGTTRLSKACGIEYEVLVYRIVVEFFG